MAFRYRVKTKPDNIGKKAPKYYAVPVYGGEISTDQLAEEIAGKCSLTKADVVSSIIALVDRMENHLQGGRTVKLDELGIFSLSATSDGFEQPNECTPSKVRAQKICYRADNKLKKNLQFVEFERDKSE